jgi:GNAT superfamily N-acetyltransferase
MIPADLGLVFQSWFRSGGQAYPGVGGDIYLKGMEGRIGRLLERIPVTVAYATVAPTEILGWVCADATCLHFIYVKPVYRRQGIARALVPESVKTYSHPPCRTGEKFLKALGLEYDPFRLERA